MDLGFCVEVTSFVSKKRASSGGVFVFVLLGRVCSEFCTSFSFLVTMDQDLGSSALCRPSVRMCGFWTVWLPSFTLGLGVGVDFVLYFKGRRGEGNEDKIRCAHSIGLNSFSLWPLNSELKPTQFTLNAGAPGPDPHLPSLFPYLSWCGGSSDSPPAHLWLNIDIVLICSENSISSCHKGETCLMSSMM